MRNVLRLCALTAAFLLVAGTVAANDWKLIGLDRVNIWAMAADSSGVVLAGTTSDVAGNGPGDVWRLESDRSWTHLATFPDGVWDLEFDPSNDSIVYAGLGGGGVFKSVNGGATWAWSNLDGQIWEVAVAPSNPNVIYVANGSGDVCKSLDGGGSWDVLEVVNGPTAVDVHPTDPDTAIVGSAFNGVFVTHDGGSTWTNVNIGFIISVHFDSQNPSIVYAGDFSEGVFKSVDGGHTWSKPDPNLGATVGEIAELSGTLYINNIFDDNGTQVYRSSDGGQTWAPLPSQSGHRLFPRSLAVTSDWILIGCDVAFEATGGIFQWASDDPLELTLRLIQSVLALNLQHGISNGLDSKLETVVKLLQDLKEANNGGAIGSLGAFINAVEAQRGKEVSETDADALIGAAQEIIDLLEAS